VRAAWEEIRVAARRSGRDRRRQEAGEKMAEQAQAGYGFAAPAAQRSAASKKDVDGDPYMPYGYPYENDAQYQ
jgi:hypothetical protein